MFVQRGPEARDGGEKHAGATYTRHYWKPRIRYIVDPAKIYMCIHEVNPNGIMEFSMVLSSTFACRFSEEVAVARGSSS